jgi:tRNA threonylcarbamoyladenosine biosynthesis protein TsaE
MDKVETMKKLMTKQVVTNNAEETQQLAEAIGARLRGSETIELISDVGGGKTTFVKGLAYGAGASEVVHSPSFTISNEYNGKRVKLNHFDFYRLDEPGIMRASLEESLEEPASVNVIEWADIVKDILPEARLSIVFKVLGENKRSLSISYPEALSYLLSEESKD